MPQTLRFHKGATGLPSLPFLSSDEAAKLTNLESEHIAACATTTVEGATAASRTTEKRKRQESFAKQKHGPFHPPLPVTIRMLSDPDAVRRAGSGRVTFPMMGCGGGAAHPPHRYTKVVVCGRVMSVTHVATTTSTAPEMQDVDDDDDDEDDFSSDNEWGIPDFALASRRRLQRRRDNDVAREPKRRGLQQGRRRTSRAAAGATGVPPHTQVCVFDTTGWVMVYVFHPTPTAATVLDQRAGLSPWQLAVSVGDYVVCTGAIKTRPPVDPLPAAPTVSAPLDGRTLPSPYYTASCVSHLEVRSSDACPLSGNEELMEQLAREASSTTTMGAVGDGAHRRATACLMFRTACCRVVEDSNELLLHTFVVLETMLRRRRQTEMAAAARADTRALQERCTYDEGGRQRTTDDGACIVSIPPTVANGDGAALPPPLISGAEAAPAISLPPWLLPGAGQDASQLVVVGRRPTTSYDDPGLRRELPRGSADVTEASDTFVSATACRQPPTTLGGVAPSTLAMLQRLPRPMAAAVPPPVAALPPAHQVPPPRAAHFMRNVLRSRSAVSGCGGGGGMLSSRSRVVGATAVGGGTVTSADDEWHPHMSGAPYPHDVGFALTYDDVDGGEDDVALGPIGSMDGNVDHDAPPLSAWVAPSPFDDTNDCADGNAVAPTSTVDADAANDAHRWTTTSALPMPHRFQTDRPDAIGGRWPPTLPSSLRNGCGVVLPAAQRGYASWQRPQQHCGQMPQWVDEPMPLPPSSLPVQHHRHGQPQQQQAYSIPPPWMQFQEHGPQAAAAAGARWPTTTRDRRHPPPLRQAHHHHHAVGQATEDSAALHHLHMHQRQSSNDCHQGHTHR